MNSPDEWADNFEDFIRLKTTSTTGFQREHAAALDGVEERFNTMRNLLETGMRERYLGVAGKAITHVHKSLLSATDSAADPSITVQSIVIEIKGILGSLANAVLTPIPGEPEKFLVADSQVWAKLTGKDAQKAFEGLRTTERRCVEELAGNMEQVIVAAHDDDSSAREAAAMSTQVVFAMDMLDKLRDSDGAQWSLGGLEDFANVRLVIVQVVGRRLSQMLVDATSSCADFATAFKDNPNACFVEELTGVRDDSLGGDEDIFRAHLLTLAEQVRKAIIPRLHMFKDDAAVSAELATLCSFPPWLAVGQDCVTLAKASLGEAEGAEATATMTRSFNKVIIGRHLAKALASWCNALGAVHVVEDFSPQITVCSEKSGQMISATSTKLIRQMGDRIMTFCKNVHGKKSEDPSETLAAFFSPGKFSAVAKSSEQQAILMTALKAPLVEACHTMMKEAMSMYDSLVDTEALLADMWKQNPFARSCCLEGPIHKN